MNAYIRRLVLLVSVALAACVGEVPSDDARGVEEVAQAEALANPVPPSEEPACSMQRPFAALGYYVGADPVIFPWLQGGPTFQRWATPDCTGVGYATAGIVAWPDTVPRRCAQFHPVTFPTQPIGNITKVGEVFCADLDEPPVTQVYYRDWQKGGACVPWTLTQGQWYPWRYCGTMPLPPEYRAL
jgi:hypothetical protein